MAQSRRTGTFATMLALALIAGLTTGTAPASAWFLSPDSPNTSGAEATHVLYWIGLIVAVVIAVAINAWLVKAIINRRAVRGGVAGGGATGGSVGPRAQLRVGGALTGLFVLLLVLGIYFSEQSNEVAASESGADPVEIDVTGQQWLWRYNYPNDAYTYYRLTIPVDTRINMNVMSTDVVHSWLVPAFGGAIDAVPGKSNRVSFVAEEEGIYKGSSSEFSGQAYAAMRTEVAVVSQDEFEDFLEQRSEEIAEAQEQAALRDQENED